MKIDLTKIKELTKESIKKAADIEIARKAEEDRLRIEAQNIEKAKKAEEERLVIESQIIERNKILFEASIKENLSIIKKTAVLQALNGYSNCNVKLNAKHASEIGKRLNLLNFECIISNKLAHIDIDSDLKHSTVKLDNDRKYEISAICGNEIAEIESLPAGNNQYVKEHAINLIKNICINAKKFKLRHIGEDFFDWNDRSSDGKNINDADCVSTMISLNKKIYDVIDKCLLINSRFDKDSLKDNSNINVQWKSQPWQTGLMDNFLNPYALNWLSSGTGQGFILNLKSSIENAASNGHTNLTLDLTSLGIKEIRWGINEAFKVMLAEKPLGVIPFKVNMLKELFDYLGFSSNVVVLYGRHRLHIQW